MREWQSQAHVKHYCKYHVVFVPKYRKKSIYGTLRKDIGGILRELCRQHGVELVEGYAMTDHIHMLLFLLLAGCAGLDPYEPRNDRVEGPDQGLFTGESREFVIHRRTGRSEESTECKGQ